MAEPPPLQRPLPAPCPPGPTLQTLGWQFCVPPRCAPVPALGLPPGDGGRCLRACFWELLLMARVRLHCHRQCLGTDSGFCQQVRHAQGQPVSPRRGRVPAPEWEACTLGSKDPSARVTWTQTAERLQSSPDSGCRAGGTRQAPSSPAFSGARRVAFPLPGPGRPQTETEDVLSPGKSPDAAHGVLPVRPRGSEWQKSLCKPCNPLSPVCTPLCLSIIRQRTRLL